ncbi:response regulator [Marinobacterium aestuariivivens]|uniref:PleD family two-component system response regulator n=2 Tax=Marinobacterium aestuariivivens TaxID=1698799 RepID=A0ABW2A911_9GAMM
MESKNILVAAEDVDDAGIIHDMLRREFDNVAVSTDPGKAVEDFETHRPAVLVLAFTTLAQAQAYYLGLYRLSTEVHGMPHRTIILCSKGELEQVYVLCKKGYYANYVLFWPLGYDSNRLPMEVHHALQQMGIGEAEGPTAAEFAAQARRIQGLEAMLEQNLAIGQEQLDLASQSFDRAGDEIETALEGFSRRLASEQRGELLEHWDRGGFEAAIDRLARELDQLKQGQIGQNLSAARASIEPIRQWAYQLKQQLEPQMESIRTLQQMSDAVKPLVLIVDDDEFQHRLLRRVLAGVDLELCFAASSSEALALMHRRRPDLVLMDVGLPDVNGIDTTRRIKSVKTFAQIPVVMITGHHGQKETVIQSRKVGAADFIVKPFEKAVLMRKLSVFLNRELDA